MIGRTLEYLQGIMSKSLHNWSVASALGLWLLTGLTILGRWAVTGQDPAPGILSLFSDESMALGGLLGIVGGLHTVKAVRGVEGDSRLPKGAKEPE